MTTIKLFADDLERKEAVLDRLNEYEVRAIHKDLQAKATADFQAQFGAGYGGRLSSKSSFAAAASGMSAPVVKIEEAVAVWKQEQDDAAMRSFGSMPELTIDGTIYKSEHGTRMSAEEVVSHFTGMDKPTFACYGADKYGDKIVMLFTSLDLARSHLTSVMGGPRQAVDFMMGALEGKRSYDFNKK